MEPINIRPYEPSDERSLLELVNRIQPHLPWTDAYFRWQNNVNPAGASRIWVAEAEGRIVANYIAVPHRAYGRLGLELWWRVQDIMTDPGYRNRGLMHQLTAQATASIRQAHQTSYAFPKEIRATLRCFLRHGWVQAHRVPLLYVSDVATPLQRGIPEPSHVVPMEAFGPAVDRLWEAARVAFPFTWARDAAYLNWRYGQKPGAHYRPFGLWDGETLVGLLVMKLYTAAVHREAHLCDMIAPVQAIDVQHTLLARALQFTVEHRAARLSAWLPVGHPYEAAYEAVGFERDPAFAQWLLVCPPVSDEGAASFELPTPWNLSIGDHDVY